MLCTCQSAKRYHVARLSLKQSVCMPRQLSVCALFAYFPARSSCALHMQTPVSTTCARAPLGRPNNHDACAKARPLKSQLALLAYISSLHACAEVKINYSSWRARAAVARATVSSAPCCCYRCYPLLFRS